MAKRERITEQTPEALTMSVEEYLRFEARSPIKHEYVKGEVYAMTGVTFRHSQILLNIATHLRAAARGGPCRVAADVKVRATKYVFYYPDVTVVCGPVDDAALATDAPCLVVEVTSRTTERTDRREKLAQYRRIRTLRSYLIVSHRRRHVRRYWRGRNGAWRSEEIARHGKVPVPCPKARLTLDEIYEGVSLPLSVAEEEASYDVDDALAAEHGLEV